jgi:HlyD family secretion protein
VKLNKRNIIITSAAAVVLAVIAGLFLCRKKDGQTTYTFVEVTKGDIENAVNATGTIEPVTTVQVGTQVSGIINKIYVDFNDRVSRNQLLAVIDTTILSLQVRDAQAGMLRSQAEFDQTKYNFDRTEKLFQQGLLSEYEYITAKSNYQSAQSSLLSSRNSLGRAEQNMRYAFIRSPIHGTIIYRAIEEGQTVASSFQTPELFLIAEDLSKMEIHSLVDESEIGLIKTGQSVRFEVTAHDDKTFTGTVRQVWMQPETVQNVVNYTVVVDAENPDGLLMPGMTANIDILVEQKKNVWLVPTAATKIQPTEKMMQTWFASMRKRFGGRADSSRASGRPSGAGFGGPMAGGSGGSGFPSGGTRPGAGAFPQAGTGSGMPGMNFANFAMLWSFDKKKELQAMPVRIGSTDGKMTQIIPMPGVPLEAGMKIIGGIETKEKTSAPQNRTTQPMRGGFGRPF